MRSSKIPQLMLVLAFFGVCAAGALDLIFHNLPRRQLTGIYPPKPVGRLNWERWKKGGWQSRAETWVSQSSALRSNAIPLVNEFTVGFLNQVSAGYSTSVQIGEDNHFWPVAHLRPKLFRNGQLNSKFFNKWQKLLRLKELLAARGIPLITIIQPGLILQYPELIPARYLARDRVEYVGATAAFKNRQMGPPDFLIDVQHLLRAKAKDFPFRFFGPTGSHLLEVGACLTTREILQKLQDGWNEKRAKDIRCEDYEILPGPKGAEIDILKIVNLINPQRFYRATPYLKTGAIEPDDPMKFSGRRFLLVGTSYFFGIERLLLRENPANTTNHLFYFKSRRRNGKGPLRPLTKSKIDWEVLLKTDAVLIDASESEPGKLGFGFIEEALNYLEKPLAK